MNQTEKPKALLLISSHCPHCHTLETVLIERKNKGVIGDLDVINIEQRPEIAMRYGVRSVPWLQIGHFVFDSALTPAELDRWIEHAQAGSGHTSYIAYLLEHGQLIKAIEWLEKGYATLESIIPLLADPQTKINVRIGVGAILEHFEDTDAIKAIVSSLTTLLQNNNSSIRTDTCHYLSLTHSVEAIEPLKKMLEDEDQHVREVARESMEVLIQ